MTGRTFSEAEQAVARIAGVSAGQVEITAEGGRLFVNWQQSMLCAGAQRDAVKQAVAATVPAPYNSFAVSIT